jgi:hypothetical protein
MAARGCLRNLAREARGGECLLAVAPKVNVSSVMAGFIRGVTAFPVAMIGRTWGVPSDSACSRSMGVNASRCAGWPRWSSRAWPAACRPRIARSGDAREPKWSSRASSIKSWPVVQQLLDLLRGGVAHEAVMKVPDDLALGLHAAVIDQLQNGEGTSIFWLGISFELAVKSGHQVVDVRVRDRGARSDGDFVAGVTAGGRPARRCDGADDKLAPVPLWRN